MRNVNTVRWESRNMTTKQGEIDYRKSEVIAFVVNAFMNVAYTIWFFCYEVLSRKMIYCLLNNTSCSSNEYIKRLPINLIHQFKSGWIAYKHCKTKRSISDPVLWQKPLHQQKCQKGKVTTQTTPQKSSIKQQLRTDLGRSVGVTTATQLVWLTWFTGPPSHSPQQPCK